MSDMKSTINFGYLIFLSVVAALGGFLFGYDTAVISGTIAQVTQLFQLDTLQQGWYVGCALIGSIVGVLFAGILSDKLGRKMTMIISHYPEQIAQMIAQKVGRAATFLWAEGSYTHNHKKIVLCACNNKELYIIRKNVLLIDPEAFVVIMDSNEVLGEGLIEPGVVN